MLTTVFTFSSISCIWIQVRLGFGNGVGYFTGDKDASHEPLLYLKGMGSSNSSPLINQPPTADSKSVFVKINTAVVITLSGNDPDNDPISFNIMDPPKKGQISLMPGNTVRYTPSNAFIGQDTFTYISRDDKGTTSANKATISITVGRVSVRH